MTVEIYANPAADMKSTGMQAVACVIEKKADVILTGYCSPLAEKYLRANGIKVIQNLQGKGFNILEQYKKKGYLFSRECDTSRSEYKSLLGFSLLQTLRQVAVMLPLIGGVIGLLGLFNAFVSKQVLLSIFPGSNGLDTLAGSCLGSISAGNPVNSYILGNALLKRGVSLFGITAFIVAWVSVGLLQLPAEISILGRRFAIYRNALSFLMAGVIAFLTVTTLQLLPGNFF
jgi:uncharacterized membrane protein YraQ (UPF0718 family)